MTEQRFLQAGVDSVYYTFKSRVAAGRQKSVDYIDSIAQGRVWTGADAIKVGLVDKIGTLKDALASAAKMAKLKGYSVKSYDINIESYHYFLDQHGEDYWKSERYFMWTNKENFDKYILPDLQPILYRVADEIAFSGVKVVGFSLYSTNYYATMVMVRYLRELVPDICIVVGGPETITGYYWFEGEAKNLFNYIFVGEAEETLLHTLETLPEKYPVQQFIGSVDSRLDLDVYAYPDYSDYSLTNYLMSGASIETSRGCVAKCSFCTETHFWKFRSTTPERVVEEIENQVEKYGVKHFWFVDSLVNGDIKNFIQLLDLLIEKPWKIGWNSYARCDGRMTEEVFKKITDSGCSALSFGVESGSQKVLDDMKKKIKVWENKTLNTENRWVCLIMQIGWWGSRQKNQLMLFIVFN